MKKKLISLMLMLCCLASLSGCWDSRQLENIYLVEGLGLDKGENEDEISLTVQIANTQAGSTPSGEKGGGGDGGGESLTLTQSAKTASHALSIINHNSNKMLMLDHTQVLVFSEDIAKEGIIEKLDMFNRVQDARVEIPVVICEGTAKDFLGTELKRDKFTSNYIFSSIEILAGVSEVYKVRVVDLINNILTTGLSYCLPVIKVVEKEDKKELKYVGTAVLKEGKIVGMLSNYESTGRALAGKSAKEINVQKQVEQGKVSIRIDNVKCKKSVTIDKQNKIKVVMDIKGLAEVYEIEGFKGYKKVDLLKELTKILNQVVKEHIEQCISKSKELKADIFDVCNMVNKKYNKFWKKNILNWDNIYDSVEFEIKSKVKVPETGDIEESVELKEHKEKKEVVKEHGQI